MTKFFFKLPFSNGRLARFVYSPAQGVALTASQRAGDTTIAGFGHAKDNGQVFFFDATLFELLFEVSVSCRGLGQNKHAAGVFVEAVDEAAAAAGVATSKPVGYGARLISNARLYGEAGGFVDDNDVFIFVKDRRRGG